MGELNCCEAHRDRPEAPEGWLPISPTTFAGGNSFKLKTYKHRWSEHAVSNCATKSCVVVGCKYIINAGLLEPLDTSKSPSYWHLDKKSFNKVAYHLDYPPVEPFRDSDLVKVPAQSQPADTPRLIAWLSKRSAPRGKILYVKHWRDVKPGLRNKRDIEEGIYGHPVRVLAKSALGKYNVEVCLVSSNFAVFEGSSYVLV